MDFVLTEDSKKYERGFRELLLERGYGCESGISVQLKESTKREITVFYEKERAVITAPGTVFLYRGLMSLVMHLETHGTSESYAAQEEIWLDHNGCMVDSSRNCVMSVPAAKAWMRMQACVGMNVMMLYTEDTYEVPEYPYFGALRGRYTAQEFKELDDYAQMLGIELIPCIEALGHLQQPLRWPAMRDLRDTSDIALVGEEKVYDFLRACIRQVSRCFRTRKVHLGMDEAWSLGLGKYLIKNGYTPKREIIRTHMDRVMELCREEGLEPMIWSDMYFRIHSETEDYYDVKPDTDMRTGALPPEGMSLVYWDYYHTDEEYYRNYIKLHRQLTSRVIFAGGGWTWCGIAPALQTAEAVTRAAFRACRAEKLRDAFYTLWADDGTETPQFAGLGAVLLAAEYGFGEEPDEKRIGERFEFLTGCDYQTYLELGKFDLPSGKMSDGAVGADPSKGLFFQDLLLGIYDGQTEGVRYGSYYGEIAEKLERGTALHRTIPGFWSMEMKQILNLYEIEAKILSKKADLGLRILEAYQKSEKEILKGIAETEIPDLIGEVERCHSLRETLWMNEGKVFGWEVLDIRYYGMSGRMASTAKRLIAYADGRLPSLPELEEKRLPVFPANTGERRMEGGYLSWIDIAAVSPLAWAWLPQVY